MSKRHIFPFFLIFFFQNSHLSIEEFHAKLQEATNFPLRPFVIPFLKVSFTNNRKFQVQCGKIVVLDTFFMYTLYIGLCSVHLSYAKLKTNEENKQV